MVVGDSVWDLLAARRAGCLGIGVLSGGYGKEELEQVGAYRVYLDPTDLQPTSMKLASELWTRERKGRAMRRTGDKQNTQSGIRNGRAAC